MIGSLLLQLLLLATSGQRIAFHFMWLYGAWQQYFCLTWFNGGYTWTGDGKQMITCYDTTCNDVIAFGCVFMRWRQLVLIFVRYTIVWHSIIVVTISHFMGVCVTPVIITDQVPLADEIEWGFNTSLHQVLNHLCTLCLYTCLYCHLLPENIVGSVIVNKHTMTLVIW